MGTLISTLSKRITMFIFSSILVIFLCLSTIVSDKPHTNEKTVTCKGGTGNNVCNDGVCKITCQDGSQVNLDCKDGSVSMINKDGDTEITCGPPVKLAPCFPFCGEKIVSLYVKTDVEATATTTAIMTATTMTTSKIMAITTTIMKIKNKRTGTTKVKVEANEILLIELKIVTSIL